MIYCPAHREQASSRLRYSADRSQVSARFAFVVWPEEFLRGSDEKHAFDWDNSRSPSSAAIRCAPAFIVSFPRCRSGRTDTTTLELAVAAPAAERTRQIAS